LEEDSFKGIGKKLKRDEHEGQMEEHASSHVEDVCMEENQTTTYDTPLELTNEADDTSVLGGKDEDATSCPTYDDYEKMFQSTDVEDSTSLLVYDAYDEGGSSVIAPTHDEDSTPYPIYDMYDDACMIVPEYDEWELCMESDNKGDELVDEILYEDDSPHESHHCMVSSSESVGLLCDNPHHVDEITLCELENRLLVRRSKLCRC
jgi:hypothetical protein